MTTNNPLIDETCRKWPAGRHLTIGLLTLALLVVGLGGWSAFASITGAIVSSGKLKVESERQVVQHPDGGVVAEILVEEGDTVEAGQPLIVLDDMMVGNELAIVEGQLWELVARRGRLAAEQYDLDEPVFDEEVTEIAKTDPRIKSLIKGQKNLFDARKETLISQTDQLRERQEQIREEISGSEAQQDALGDQLDFVAMELHDLRDLQKKGLAQASRVLALERENARLLGQRGELAANIARSRGQISEIEIQLLGLASTRREEAVTEMRDIEYRENELRERRATLLEQIERLYIRAPRPGRVIGMTVFALRSVIRPADPVLYIVPSDAILVIETEVESRNIDQIFPASPQGCASRPFRSGPRRRFSARSSKSPPTPSPMSRPGAASTARKSPRMKVRLSALAR